MLRSYASPAPTPPVPDTDDGARSWVQQRWQSFLALEPAILDLQHQAAVARGRSTDPATREAALELIERLNKLSQLHGLVVDRARALIPGLGAIGFVWPISIAAVALAVAWVFSQYDAAREGLRMIQAGQLTPDQLADVFRSYETDGGPLVAAFEAVPWIIGGLALWWALSIIPRRG